MAPVTELPITSYLIRGGAVITADRSLGTMPKADVLVRDGLIEQVAVGIEVNDVEVIDAANMIVMPGMIDSHFHMWSSLGRNFIGDGHEYFAAKWATAALYSPDDFYHSVRLGLAELANGGVTTVHNWSHNNRSPAHVDAELKAHRDSGLRARYALGHIDRLAVDEVNRFDDLPRVRAEWFDDGVRLGGLVHLGVNLRGGIQSNLDVFFREMEMMLKLKLPVAIHGSQEAPNMDDAADYERRGFLGPNFLICHFIAADDSDREAMARTKTPLSYSTHSELRLSSTGDPRRALMKMRGAGVRISLSSDATSLGPPNMFENMRLTWNAGVPWKETDTSHLGPIGMPEVIEMATINGAIALGLGDVTGSLTPGKQADIILIRSDDLNTAPLANIETAVVMGASPANVDSVMVRGRLVKRSGKLIGLDVPHIVRNAKKSAMRIRTAAGDWLAPQCAGCDGNAVFRASAC